MYKLNFIEKTKSLLSSNLISNIDFTLFDIKILNLSSNYGFFIFDSNFFLYNFLTFFISKKNNNNLNNFYLNYKDIFFSNLNFLEGISEQKSLNMKVLSSGNVVDLTLDQFKSFKTKSFKQNLLNNLVITNGFYKGSFSNITNLLFYHKSYLKQLVLMTDTFDKGN